MIICTFLDGQPNGIDLDQSRPARFQQKSTMLCNATDSVWKKVSKGRSVKRLVIVALQAGSLIIALAGSSVVAQVSPGDRAAGRELAQDVCATCHQVEKGQRGISIEGAPSFQDVADNKAMTSLALRVFLQTPHEEMPNLKLSNAETDDVITYIRR